MREMTRGCAEGEREGQQRVLSRALLNIVAHTELPDWRIHTRLRVCGARYAHLCVRSRAGARKQRVIKGLEARRSASA